MIPPTLELRAASGTGTGKPVVGRQEAGLESYLERSTPVSSVRHLMAKTPCRVKAASCSENRGQTAVLQGSKIPDISTHLIAKGMLYSIPHQALWRYATTVTWN